MGRTVRRRSRPLLFASCCGVSAISPLTAEAVTTTTPLFQGVTLHQRTETSPRPLKINVLEIDTTAAGLSFRVTPSNGALPLDTTLQTTRNFMTSQGAQLAINANFYGGTSGANTDVNSLAASDGDVYSTFSDGYNGLNIASNNVATVVRQASPDFTGYTTNPLVTVHNAVAGNRRLVDNGVNNITSPDSFDVALNPRTAAGTAPGNKLFLMTVDGRQAGVSEGVTTSELANLLIGYGVTQAINLDGGGSTTMSVANPTAGLLNVPSDGSERAVGNNLAIFAAPPTTVYWDINGGTAGAGGGTAPSGTWNGTTNNFNSSPLGASPGTMKAVTTSSDVVNFAAGTGATGSYTVTVSGTRSASQVKIEEGNLTFSGGTLAVGTFDVGGAASANVASLVAGGSGGNVVKKGTGTLTFSAANTYAGATNVNAGTLVITQGLKSGGALAVASGADAVIPASSPDTFSPPAVVPSGQSSTGSKVSSLSISGTGQLDLNNNDMVIDHSGALDLHDVRQLIGSGYNSGGQDGPGIMSTTAALTDPFTFTLGYADNANLPTPYGTAFSGGPFAGFDVDDTAALIKFTWVGDVTLDGFFDFQDLSIFNGNYDAGASTGRVWTDGDLNYDGVIDFQDLSLFNGMYDPAKPSLPEPSGALGAAAAALLCFVRSRRHRRGRSNRHAP